jgi:hypothetical protein
MQTNLWRDGKLDKSSLDIHRMDLKCVPVRNRNSELFFCLIRQLPAGGINIFSAAAADVGYDAVLFEVG